MSFRRIFVLLPWILACGAGAAWAQDRGSLSGHVSDKKTGRAVPFASVTVPSARLGGLTDSNGDFLIRNVPAGRHEVKVQFLGYKPDARADVEVVANKATTVNFALEEVVVREEKVVEVTGERPLVQLNQGSTVRTVNSTEIEKLPVRTVTQVLEQQTGISSDADQLRIRGGRADETVFVVDGVVNRDLIGGGSTAGSISAKSVAEVNVVTGGFDAKYGQAISGIVDIKLKEGKDKFEGGLGYSGGAYDTRLHSGVLSGPDVVWRNLARSVGLRVPGTLTFLLDVSADFTDTRFPNVKELPGKPALISGYEDSFLGRKFRYGDFFSRAEDNSWRLLYKLTWKPSTRNKLEGSFTKRLGIDQGFSRRDISDVTGLEPTFPWFWAHRIDHAQTVTEDNVVYSLAWTRVLSTSSFWNFQLSRYYLALHQDVLGKKWSDYERPNDYDLPDPSQQADYFNDTGDDNRWHDRRSVSYSTQWSFTKHYRRHKVEAGLQHDFQTVQYITIEDPWDLSQGDLGASHDLWRIHPWQGNFYLQDRIEYEGFIANIGLRTDYWFVGREVERALADTSNINVSPSTRDAFYEDTRSFFGRRYKTHLSPRIWVSHPISERSKFFFNYGQFTQFPSYLYVYSKLTSVSSEQFPVLGNPNLNPQVSVQYEVGGNTQTTPTTAVNLTLFLKDVYNYPTSTVIRQQEGNPPVDFLAYLNGDFARSKGFELEFEKRRTGIWSGKVGYSFTQSTGKGSDPAEAKILSTTNSASAAETRLGEAFVYWNRPHKVTLSLDLRWDREVPKRAPWLRNAGVNLFLLGQSGRAYTPQTVDGVDIGKPYSKNGPFAITVDTRINKEFRFAGQRVNLALYGHNIFDNRVARRIDSVSGRGYRLGQGRYAWSEVGRLAPDEFQYLVDGTLSNPSNYEDGSSWRVSMDYDF